MIDNKVLQAALPLTERLDATGVFLVPREGTPLYEMVRASNMADLQHMSPSNSEVVVAAAAAHETPVKLEFQPAYENLVEVANAEVDYLGGSKLDVVTDHIAEVAISSVNDHLKQAHDVVAPLVRDLAERVIASLNSLTPSKLSGMSIVEYALPAVATHASFQEILSRYVPIDLVSANAVTYLPAADVDQIQQWMQTGISSLDKEIAFWATTKGPAFVQEIWNNVFHLNREDTAPVVELTHYLRDLDSAIAIFLLSNHLFENVPEGTEVSLDKYRQDLADLRSLSAFQLNYHIEQYTKNDESGLLVMATSKPDEVLVHAGVYARYLEQGGDADALMGNKLSNVPAFQMSDILARREQLVAAWSRHCSMLVSQDEARRLMNIRTFFIDAFNNQLAGMSEEDRAVITDIEQLRHRFAHAAFEITEKDTECLYSLALRLMCQIRFPNSAAFFILSEINKQGKKNPNLAPRECAAIAAIKYINTWIAGQFQVANP